MLQYVFNDMMGHRQYLCEVIYPTPRYHPRRHPILIAGKFVLFYCWCYHSEPYYFSEQNRKDLYKALLEGLHFPYFCLVPSAVLALLAVNSKTGLVIDAGASKTILVPVFNGDPLKDKQVEFPIHGYGVDPLHQLENSEYLESIDEKKKSSRWRYYGDEVEISLSPYWTKNVVKTKHFFKGGQSIVDTISEYVLWIAICLPFIFQQSHPGMPRRNARSLME